MTQRHFQPLPVPFLESVESRCGGGRPGIDIAVQGFIAIPELLPFAFGIPPPVPVGHQLFGTELLQIFSVHFG